MVDPRSRLLLVTRNFPPLWGGMERLNFHMAIELGRRNTLHLVGPAGASVTAPAGMRVREAPLRPLWRFLVVACWAACAEASRWRPQLVLAGSGLTAPLVWLAARLSGARAGAYLHGLDVAVKHPLYRALWLPALRHMDVVVANSHATARLAEAAGIPSQRLRVVHPGVEIPAFDASARGRFRKAHGLSGQARVLLSVGRLTQRKGLQEFVREVLPAVIAAEPAAVLVVVGDAPADSLYARAQSREDIDAEARSVGLADKVLFLGKRFSSELDDAYFGADVHVFPVREVNGDPEGFGMVAVEAAAHGLWTVAYATGGVSDAVGPGCSGDLVPPGDGQAFAAAVVRALRRQPDPANLREFARRFAWEQFGQTLAQALWPQRFGNG